MYQADMEKTQGPPSTMREIREKEMADKAYRLEQLGACTTSANAEPFDPFDQLFRYHPPTPQDLPKYGAINQAAKNFAEVCRQNCPPGSDLSDAIRKIREARMTANAAIALKGLNFY